MGKLVRLELYNFKSYKGHHVLLFGDAQFTSIIGPNGSGKSNAMDAISFVLGIKSSHLRSSHLRDLIYRGRILKTSKIQADGTAADGATNGATNGNVNGHAASDDEQDDASSSQREIANMAWVMAVYEDDAGDEQQWKRVITSSGQSEYRVNNRVVNAKQYNEILEEENILIKARNFLVFQGDVEAIASQSPKDLTRLVEQISGSLEYKADYDRLQVESEQAAEDQAFKLNQRRGINAEIKQFSEQKKEADAYQRKADERDEAVVKHVLWKLYHFQRVIEESGEEIQRYQDELKEFRRNAEKYEAQLDDAKKEQAKAAKEVSRSERSIKNTEKQIDEKNHELVPINEKIELSNKKLDKYQKRISEVTKEKDTQSQSVDKLKADLQQTTKAQTKWENDFQKKAQQQGKQLNGSDLKEYNKLKSEVNRQAVNSQSEVNNLNRQRKTDEETVNTLKSSVDETQGRVQKLESEINDVQERIKSNESKASQCSKDIEVKKKEFNKVTSERLRTAQRHTELEEKLQQVVTKLLEADDGRRQSEKQVREKQMMAALKRVFTGIHGRLHELCKPKQKKYETAVSTVLGFHFDSIVVEDQKTASNCIQYIREQQIGQATFLPLDTIQIKSFDSKLKGMHKNMRLAIDSVDYDNSIERAVSLACGNSMICDDLDTARYLCYEKNVKAKAVTLDGTIIHKAGLMTGGRGPNDRNARNWADTEVENLRKMKDDLQADLAALPKGHKAVTDEETLRGELTGLEQNLAYARDEIKALDKNMSDKRKELAHVQKQLKEAKPKYEEHAQSLKNLLGRIDGAQAQISDVEDDVFAAFCKRLGYDDIRAYEAQQGTLQREGAQKKLEFTMQKSRLENQLNFESGRLETTQERIKSLEEQSQRDQKLLDSLEEEKGAMENEIEDIESSLSQTRQALSKLKDTHNEKSDRVNEKKREVQKHHKDSTFIHDQVTRLESDVQRNASYRYALLRKCKIDEVKLPLTSNSAPLVSLPVDDAISGQDPDAMDIDEDEETILAGAPNVRDYGIDVDFDNLDEELLEVSLSPHLFTLPFTPSPQLHTH